MKWISTLIVTYSLCVAPSVLADAKSPAKPSSTTPKIGPHGGRIHAVGQRLCEVVFRPDSVRVFLFDTKGKPVTARDARGTITMQVRGKSKSYRFDLYPESTQGDKRNCLYVPVDLSRVENGEMTTKFSVVGIVPNVPAKLAFTQPFRLTPTADELAIARQRICLVSGKRLGSRGKPVKTKVGDRAVFVCCSGCEKPLRENPIKYVSRLAVRGKTTTRE